MQNITAIIVSYNTPDLLRNAIASVRRFYPTLPVIIIDGSPPDSECWMYCQMLGLEPNMIVKCVEYNIGHGNGMKMGISMVETEYFLLMDSDVEIKNEGCLEFMIEVFENSPKVYGFGNIVEVNKEGGNIPNEYTVTDKALEISKPGAIPYLHPHFALIKKSMNLKYAPIINHGAPMIKAMVDLHEKKEDYPAYWPVDEWVVHHERGTRKLNPKEFNPGNWDNV